MLAQFAGGLVVGVGQIATGYVAYGQLVAGYYSKGQIDLGHLLWRFLQENPEIGRFFQALGEFLQRLVGKS